MTGLSCKVSIELCRLKTGTRKTCGTFPLEQMTNAQSSCGDPSLFNGSVVRWLGNRTAVEIEAGGVSMG